MYAHAQEHLVLANRGVFTPEVVVFHLLLHQFGPVGGKKNCMCLCTSLCAPKDPEDPNSSNEFKKTERKTKDSLCYFLI